MVASALLGITCMIKNTTTTHDHNKHLDLPIMFTVSFPADEALMVVRCSHCTGGTQEDKS